MREAANTETLFVFLNVCTAVTDVMTDQNTLTHCHCVCDSQGQAEESEVSVSSTDATTWNLDPMELNSYHKFTHTQTRVTTQPNCIVCK